jgi:hypothetical protein
MRSPSQLLFTLGCCFSATAQALITRSLNEILSGAMLFVDGFAHAHGACHVDLQGEIEVRRGEKAFARRFAMVLRIWLTGTSSKASPPAAPNTALPPVKFSMSCLGHPTIRTAEPGTTRPMSMPFSSASCLAKGLAFTRPFAGVCMECSRPHRAADGFGAGTLPVAAAGLFWCGCRPAQRQQLP